ncbi:hypothetical protein RMCBS344292_13922 [Rhizopus microsporus]|nr:hypothetical protein RMCBS344292_13922 [Rhizopus microsporus]
MGIPRSRFRELTGGKSVEEFLNREQLNMFLEAGFLIDEQGLVDDRAQTYIPHELLSQWKDGGGIRPTEAGLERIDYILPRLLESN